MNTGRTSNVTTTADQDSVADGTGAAAAGNTSGRLVLLLIAGIPVTIILASSWLWYFVVQGDLDLVGRLGTSNAGQLLQPPRQALEANWQSAGGAEFSLAEEPRWLPHVMVNRLESVPIRFVRRA